MSRIKNTMRNIEWGMLNRLILIILPFIMRTVLIKQMGASFVGLNGLFESILQVLNLFELGIGTAITFSLYKPLAQNNDSIVRATLNLYRKLYRKIGIAILIIGLAVMPFLKNFINGDIPSNINIYILYGIYLANTVLTYLLYAYKITLLNANQRNDIISKINIVIYLIQFIYQVFVIINFRNYYLYIVIMPVITIINNIICTIYAKKMYPQYYCSENLPNENKKEIKKRIYGLVIKKICNTTRNSFDSIFISSFWGLNMVAIYNNYYIISSTITGVLSVLTNSMISGIGNSVATENVDKNYNDMNKFNFIYMWISGWFSICLLCLYQPFIKIWLGNEYLLDFSTVIFFCFYFYTLKMGDILAVYIHGTGLWWEERYRVLVESILNVILNFALGKLFGINGIIVGTLLSLLFVGVGYGAVIVFKFYFKGKNVLAYYKKHVIYFVTTIIIASITYLITNTININIYANLIVISLICIIIPNLFYYFTYRKYYLFKETVLWINDILKNKNISNGRSK